MNIKYDALGFPIFNKSVKFELRLNKNLLKEIDEIQFLECIKQLQVAGKIQLVDADIHDYAGHLAGKELWGGGIK